jgi:hypothetical protein
MKDETTFLLTFVCGGVVLSFIAFAAMYVTFDGNNYNLPDKYTIHTLDKQYIGNATGYNFATHEEEFFNNVLIFETTQLSTYEKFGEYIYKEDIKTFNRSEWTELRTTNLYFANEHELAGHVQEGDIIIVRWVFDKASQQYAVKGVINETELKNGDY